MARLRRIVRDALERFVGCTPMVSDIADAALDPVSSDIADTVLHPSVCIRAALTPVSIHIACHTQAPLRCPSIAEAALRPPGCRIADAAKWVVRRRTRRHPVILAETTQAPS